MSNSFLSALEQASLGKRDDLRSFFKLLLRQEVFVPLKEGASSKGSALFYSARGGEGEIVPFFSSNEFLEMWAEREMPHEKIVFSAFLWRLPESFSAHLNPGQEVGKEFSPWELQQLRQGEEGIDDIIVDLLEEEVSEFDVESAHEQFPEIVKHLKGTAEVYPQIEEVFLALLRKGQDAREAYLAVGIRYGSERPKNTTTLHEEMKNVVLDDRSVREANLEVVIFDDLADQKSANRRLFSDMTPFYFRTKSIARSKPTFLSRFLGRGKSKSTKT